MTLNIFDIVKIYLENNGYDGLYNESECACLLSDLMPCETPEQDCFAGYKCKGDEFSEFYVRKEK